MGCNRAKLAPCSTSFHQQRTWKAKADCQKQSKSISQPFEVPQVQPQEREDQYMDVATDSQDDPL